MCEILISIKSAYVEKIFAQEKIYEYRKTKAKIKPDKIIIYCTAPISAVVGEAEVAAVLSGTPAMLWNETKEQSGSDELSFFQYFKDKNIGVAYKLANVKRYDRNIPLSEYGLKAAPQSFVYLSQKT